MLIVSVATCAVSKSWARISMTATLSTGSIFANIAMQSRIHRRCASVVVLALMAIVLLSATMRFIDSASHVANASIKSRDSTWKQKKGTCALDVNLAARNAMGQSLVARRSRSMARNTIKNALLARLVVSAYVVVITRLIGAYSDVAMSSHIYAGASRHERVTAYCVRETVVATQLRAIQSCMAAGARALLPGSFEKYWHANIT
eukprot:CAMPEP_0169386748 /NCGR_PEP_ID=MMETSP1017-20121227/44955_1 /TAXON_ID=342587 /ORGANISM="Karlodinium micrum, Strain CCMP2283" /LENGTH=203 /DNA_ID=CAMNT_0009488051 /DNA_START=429 /DNA_END=1037 /DNA_ORIENTATION=+